MDSLVTSSPSLVTNCVTNGRLYLGRKVDLPFFSRPVDVGEEHQRRRDPILVDVVADQVKDFSATRFDPLKT